MVYILSQTSPLSYQAIRHHIPQYTNLHIYRHGDFGSHKKKSFPVQYHSNRFAKLLYFISSENIKAEYSSWQLSLAVVRKCPLCTSGAERLDKFVCAGVWIVYRQEGRFYVGDSNVGRSSAGWAATHCVSFCTHLLKWLIICVQLQRRGYRVERE
jgi:hypothetical protein